MEIHDNDEDEWKTENDCNNYWKGKLWKYLLNVLRAYNSIFNANTHHQHTKEQQYRKYLLKIENEVIYTIYVHMHMNMHSDGVKDM